MWRGDEEEEEEVAMMRRREWWLGEEEVVIWRRKWWLGKEEHQIQTPEHTNMKVSTFMCSYIFSECIDLFILKSLQITSMVMLFYKKDF